MTSKFKRRNDEASPSPENILENLAQCTKEFQRALGTARDRAIEGTETMTRATGIRAIFIHKDVQDVKDNTNHIRTDLSRYTSAVERAGGEVSSRVADLGLSVRRVEQKMDQEATVREKESHERTRQHQDIRNLIISEFGELKKLSERENWIARREMAVLEDQQTCRTLMMNLLLQWKRRWPIETLLTSHYAGLLTAWQK